MRNVSAFLILMAVDVLFCDAIRKNAAIAQNVPDSTSASQPEKAGGYDRLVKKTEQRLLIREGTTMQSQHAIFRIAGNRLVMTTVQGSERHFCLENLNLQRIHDVLRENPTLTDWTVDFIVTEYKGENYVLIQRAVLTSSASRNKNQEK